MTKESRYEINANLTIHNFLKRHDRHKSQLSEISLLAVSSVIIIQVFETKHLYQNIPSELEQSNRHEDERQQHAPDHTNLKQNRTEK